MPKRKGMSTTQNHLCYPLPFLAHGKLLRRLYGPSSCHSLENQYILIIDDLFTKYIETAALPLIETLIITQVFLDKIVFRHGPPHRFLTDRGTNFKSKLMTQLCNDLNINKVFTSSYHPQCDCFFERINGVIIQIIAMYVASDHKYWDT